MNYSRRRNHSFLVSATAVEREHPDGMWSVTNIALMGERYPKGAAVPDKRVTAAAYGYRNLHLAY